MKFLIRSVNAYSCMKNQARTKTRSVTPTGAIRCRC